MLDNERAPTLGILDKGIKKAKFLGSEETCNFNGEAEKTWFDSAMRFQVLQQPSSDTMKSFAHKRKRKKKPLEKSSTR